MKFAIQTTIGDKTPTIEPVLNREAAQAKLVAMIGEYTKKGYQSTIPEVHAVEDSISLTLSKEGEPSILVKAYNKFPGSSDRPYTGKHKAFALLMSKVTKERIALDVEAVISTCLKGEFDMDAQMIPGNTVAQVIGAQGFFMNDIVLFQVIEAFMGRLYRQGALSVKIDLEDPQEMARCLPIIMKSNEVEKKAIPLVRERLIKKHGTPVSVDETAIEEILKRVEQDVLTKFKI